MKRRARPSWAGQEEELCCRPAGSPFPVGIVATAAAPSAAAGEAAAASAGVQYTCCSKERCDCSNDRQLRDGYEPIPAYPSH